MNRLVAGILAIALAIAGGLALLASESPDGLEYTMEQTGIHEGEPVHPAPMADYEAPFLQNPTARRVLAGLSGTLAVLGLTLAAGWALRRAGRRESTD